ncbi:MurR/RpiR family transcriptional regulator [Clostridium chrysemydis]|uniref:MurR/RpiR family transcriptional regulator n=1 Tax=Clostridium chrysemydis TaxID=2665504 RepID=UPI003F33099F
MSLLKKYQENEGFLTKTEKECFEKLLRESRIEKDITIQKIADEFNVSTTTIFRMIKNLGYVSFKEFRYELLYHKREELNVNDSKEDLLFAIGEKLNETIKYLSEIDIDPIVNLIKSAKHVMVIGSGMNHYIGEILEVKLNLCNIDAKYREDSWLMYLETSNLTSEDVVIVLSKTGETKSLIEVIKNAKINGSKILYIGEIGHSKIGALADFKIYVSKVIEEGRDMDTRLQLHLAINYLTKKLIDEI